MHPGPRAARVASFVRPTSGAVCSASSFLLVLQCALFRRRAGWPMPGPTPPSGWAMASTRERLVPHRGRYTGGDRLFITARYRLPRHSLPLLKNVLRCCISLEHSYLCTFGGSGTPPGCPEHGSLVRFARGLIF